MIEPSTVSTLQASSLSFGMVDSALLRTASIDSICLAHVRVDKLADKSKGELLISDDRRSACLVKALRKRRRHSPRQPLSHNPLGS